MNNNLIQLSGVDLVVPTHGIEGAKAYPMGPNCRAPLFDDAEDIFYIKSTDANGFPTVKVFEFKEKIMIDQNNSGNGVVLEDIRSLIREELSVVKEELLNGQQSISAASSEQANRNESGNTSTNKHNGNAKSYNTSSSDKSNKQQRQNSSVVEHGENGQ